MPHQIVSKACITHRKDTLKDQELNGRVGLHGRFKAHFKLNIPLKVYIRSYCILGRQ